MGAGKRLLALLLVLAMAAGAWVACARHLLENNNRRVELAADARLLGGGDFGRGYSPQEKLLMLQEAGCTAVAVSPLSLNELERTGQIVSLTPTIYLVTGDEGLGERLQAALSLLLPDVELKKIKARPAPLTGAGGEAAVGEETADEETAGEETADEETAGEETAGEAVAINGLSAEELTTAALHNGKLIAAGPGAGGVAEYQALSLSGRYVTAVKELPLLLPREQMLSWQRAGLRIVPLFNYPARLSPLLSEKYWEVLARQLQEIKRTTEIQFGPVAFPAASFSYPAPQGAAGQIFREEGLSLGAVEFTQGQGLRELAAALDYRLLRTHQIPGAELAQLGEVRARERFLRAVQERKVRLLLLQPFPEFDPRSEWANYLPLIQDLGRDLQKAGFHPGEASFFPSYQPPAAAEALLGAGIAAAAVLLAGFFLGRDGKEAAARRFYPLAGAILILAAAGFLLAGERLPFYTLGRQLAALAAALVFPLLSIVLFLEPPLHAMHTTGKNENNEEGEEEEKEREEKEREGKIKKSGNKHGGFLKRFVGGFLLASLLTTGGALLAAGLLGSTPFLLKIDSFRGVKIAQAGPFLLCGLWLLLQGGRGLWHTGRDFLEARLQIKHLVLLALAGGALLIYLLRGGNTSLLPVSGWELALRRQLEVLLVARPRFKEFLIGHPGFFLFAALAAQHLRGAQTLALLLGLLGQISLFNTFMHLHRPVGLSLLGTAYGAGLGLLGGLVLYCLAGAVARRWPTHKYER